MPRLSRKISTTGTYHIMLRGTDRRLIFADDEDYRYFLKILSKVRDETLFSLYTYCLMSNHSHLLAKEGNEPISDTMKRIEIMYAHHYNQKYELCGHLFQDRFRSEPVNDERAFLSVMRYICHNPVKAGLCDDPFLYPWLGCSGVGICAGDGLLDPLTGITDFSERELYEFIKQESNEEHLEYTTKKFFSDEKAVRLLCNECHCKNIVEIGGWEKNRLAEAILTGAKIGLSARQFSRITGVSRHTVNKIRRAAWGSQRDGSCGESKSME